MEKHIDQLQHYARYAIHIQACREKEGTKDEESTCSNKSSRVIRTQAKSEIYLKKNILRFNILMILGGVDNVTNLHITNQGGGTVALSWVIPKQPNGQILAYQIEYKRQDIENVKKKLIFFLTFLYVVSILV